jgi:imidazolonepropionase-like amidohydrolase
MTLSELASIGSLVSGVAVMISLIYLAHQTVIVRGKCIVAMGPENEIAVPAGARVIDGGRWF